MSKVIVQVVQHLRPGGIETMAIDLLNQLETQADVHIFSLEGDKATALKQWPRLVDIADKLHFFEKPAGLALSLVKQLTSALKQLSASSVHTHHIGPLLYAGLAAKYLGVKHVHTEHDAWHLNSISNRRLQRSLIALLKPVLVADCNEVADILTRHFPKAKPRVIHNGIDVNRFTPPSRQQKLTAKRALNLPTNVHLVGCAARLETVKGHEILLKAFSRTHLNLHLVLAGSGSLRKSLERLAETLGISQHVTFLGNLDDILPLYHAIDTFCLPSLNEGLPLSPLEAQSCGVPVILTNVGGCKSIACPDTGVVVPANNIQQLQEALLSQSIANHTHSPRQFILNKCNLNKTAQAYFHLLEPAMEV